MFAILDGASPETRPSSCTRTSGCVHEANHAIKFHNPAQTGYDYNCILRQSGGCERSAWTRPVEGGRFVHHDLSGSDCRKKRTLIIGHKARSSLWVWMCMKHHQVVGQHIIKRGEGKRDAVISLYRFMNTAPKFVFVDFACHAEECGLNWLASYYQNTQFFHDTFHGYGHKCSARFSCEGLKGCPATNTSVMEQYNSFLQPVRGILSSGSTRVRSYSKPGKIH